MSSLLLLFFLSLVFSAYSNKYASRGLPADVDWIPTYNEALERAKTNGKNIMVFFTQPWCGACKNLKEGIAGSPEAFIEASKELNMVSVEGDDANEGPSNVDAFQTDGGYIPRVYFVTPEGKIDTTIVGPQPRYQHYFPKPNDLIAAMKKAANLGLEEAHDEL